MIRPIVAVHNGAIGEPDERRQLGADPVDARPASSTHGFPGTETDLPTTIAAVDVDGQTVTMIVRPDAGAALEDLWPRAADLLQTFEFDG